MNTSPGRIMGKFKGPETGEKMDAVPDYIAKIPVLI